MPAWSLEFDRELKKTTSWMNNGNIYDWFMMVDIVMYDKGSKAKSSTLRRLVCEKGASVEAWRESRNN